MTVSECYTEVLNIGGDGADVPFAAFAGALKRAMYAVMRLTPIYKEVSITHAPASNAGETRYDLQTLANDFSAFTQNPVKENIAFRVTEGHYLHLPNEKSGVYTVRYRPKVTLYTEENGNSVIPLSDEAASLLPKAVAAEVYFDEDVIKAKSLLGEYRAEAAELLRSRGSHSYAGIADLYGW